MIDLTDVNIMSKDEYDYEKLPLEEQHELLKYFKKKLKKSFHAEMEHLLQNISNGMDCADFVNLLNSTGSGPPPNDPKNSISGVGEKPPDDEDDTVKISSEDFYFQRNNFLYHDVNLNLDGFENIYFNLKRKNIRG